MLAWRDGANPAAQWAVPEAVAARWREALDHSARQSLAQQAALRLLSASLTARGIAFVVLKGARLAWSVYPAPALRPMRDLDVLVAPQDLLPAAQALAQAGFSSPLAESALLARAMAEDKHLPPLWHETLGVAVELHHRLTDLPARRAYHGPQLDPAAMLAGAEAVELGGVAMPCPRPNDLLAHLMVHALYGHRLDCGPLVLADIHFLLDRETIDWRSFWEAARQDRWSRGAALLLALVERRFSTHGAVLPPDVAQPPIEMIEAAEEAMLQDLDERGHGEAMADLFAARSPAALGGAIRRRLTPDAQVKAREGEGMPAWRFWPVWAWRRMSRLADRARDPRVAAEARQAAALLRWLQS
jgi:hypothetical protein